VLFVVVSMTANDDVFLSVSKMYLVIWICKLPLCISLAAMYQIYCLVAESCKSLPSIAQTTCSN
jgi:hypothetical protein